MHIISWNVNGLRALVRKGGFDWLLSQKSGIFCLQETKAHPDQLEEGIRNPQDYESLFDHSKTRKGYSGVAIYINKSFTSKIKKVWYEVGVKELDQEGRFIAVDFGDFVLINSYFPNGGGGPERLDYKLRFYKAFLVFINKQRKQGKEVIFCGDINTAHTEIDLARPKENLENTGFLPIERAWIDEVIESGFVDVYRQHYPEKTGVYTYWDMKTFARERNVGWRIDYFFASQHIYEKIISMKTHNNVLGSDHCPIEIDIKI